MSGSFSVAIEIGKPPRGYIIFKKKKIYQYDCKISSLPHKLLGFFRELLNCYYNQHGLLKNSDQNQI